jgi:hypothetical protein
MQKRKKIEALINKRLDATVHAAHVTRSGLFLRICLIGKKESDKEEKNKNQRRI